MSAWAAALAACVLTPLLAAWARRRGWIDRRDGDEALRKPREAPVPLVGGVAVVLALLASSAVEPASPASLPWIALLAALAVGVWDDLRPLAAGAKLSAHLVLAGILAFEASRRGAQGPGGEWQPAVFALVAVFAINAANTWDHADGLLGGCALLGLALPCGRGAAACAGFLPWNLVLGRGPDRAGDNRVPVAYLGDGGSHALGILLAWFPQAWPALVVPLVDLARVVVLRLRAGKSPFVGDRLHFGQRLEGAGLPTAGSALVAALCVAPGVLATPFVGLAVGLGTSLALYLVALALSRGQRAVPSL